MHLISINYFSANDFSIRITQFTIKYKLIGTLILTSILFLLLIAFLTIVSIDLLAISLDLDSESSLIA